MSRKCFFVLFMVITIGIQPLFAQTDDESPEAQSPDPAAQANSTDATTEIPQSIRNNEFFLESQRLANLAQETYQYGDYDLAASLAEEAIRYAELSDEYVALQLRILAANNAIATAKGRLDWATSSGASRQHPAEYREAENWYNRSLTARTGEDWDGAYDAAQRVIDLLAYMQNPTGAPPPPRTASVGSLPATYTVRSWNLSKDCFWNIAARPWVYGDGRRWRVLYNANKSKLPDPNNPNLIEPGMVIEIPSIRGETRQGAWSPNATYRSLN